MFWVLLLYIWTPGLHEWGLNRYGGGIPKRDDRERHSDEYDGHVGSSITVINYLRCFKASWWLQPFLIGGERLERSGRAFVMDRICMHTLRLSLHSGYKQTRQSHTHSGAHFLFFPLNLMVENSAAAHTLFHWASCHLKPMLTASMLCIMRACAHTHTHTLQSKTWNLTLNKS